jgi:ABC-type Fe3+ transport system permease subunit
MDTLAFTSGLACLVIFIATLFVVIYYRSERRRRQNLSRLRQHDRAAWKRHRLS